MLRAGGSVGSPAIDRARRVGCDLREQRRQRAPIARRDQPAIHAVGNELGEAADARADDGRAGGVRFDRHGRSALEAHGRATQDVERRQVTGHVRRRDRRPERHARIVADGGLHLAQHVTAVGGVERTPDVEVKRQIARQRRDRAREIVDALDRIEASHVPESHRRARRPRGGVRFAHEGPADPQPIERQLLARRAVADDGVERPRGQDDEPIDAIDELHLPPMIERHRRRHAERRAELPRQRSGGGARAHRETRDRARGPLRQTPLLQIARGALAHLGEAVAQRPAPAHHRAARADVAQAAGVRRRDHARARRLRRVDLRNSESRHQGVKVNDVRARPADPVVKPFAAAHARAALCLEARQRMRDRKPMDGRAVVDLAADGVDRGIGRDDLDVVAETPQPRRQPRHVRFGAAGRDGEIPTHRLNDLHATRRQL